VLLTCAGVKEGCAVSERI